MPSTNLDAGASVEFPRGTVSACTPADRAALTDLYRAVYPNAAAAEIAGDVRDDELPAWITYRDGEGEIRAAMFIRADGVALVLARPEESDAPEVKTGFLRVAKEARAAVAKYGVSELIVFHAASLEPLGRALEREGFLTKQLAIARVMHFGEHGEIIRAN